MIDFSGITLPFTLNDFLQSSMHLVKLFGAFILFSLCWFLYDTVVDLFSIAFGTYRDNKINKNAPKHQYTYRQAVKTHFLVDKYYFVIKRFKK